MFLSRVRKLDKNLFSWHFKVRLDLVDFIVLIFIYKLATGSLNNKLILDIFSVSLMTIGRVEITIADISTH